MQQERWRTIEELFHAALDRLPEERAAFLSEACGSDSTLRREVESLLSADGDGGTLERSALAEVGSVERLFDELRARFASSARPDISGRVQAAVGSRYLIERELRGGGMSRVFVAQETELRRRVVIKVLAPSLGAELDSERFQREIRIAASLQHPHILPVHSAGEGQGLLYYTMPFVEGESLRQRIDRVGPLPLPEAVALLRELTDALAYAHRRGIIHRDLKPANVLFGEGHALIIDFGIAKALSAAADLPESADTAAGFTTAGIVLGTPTYMAPEQAAGDPVDHRADLYALGCVAYEILTGRPPFTGDSVQALVAAHLADDPEPIGTLRAHLPKPLAGLVMHLLAKHPAERPASADQVARTLQTLDTAELEAVPGRTGGRSLVRRLLRRRSARRGAVVMALSVLAGAAGVAVWHTRTTPSPGAGRTMLAVLPFANLGRPDDEYFASGLTDEITSRLAGLERLGVISGASAGQYRNSTKSPRDIGRELGVAYLLEGSVRWERPAGAPARVRVIPQLVRVDDESHLWSDRYDANLSDLFDVQASIAEEVAGALNVALAGRERTALAARPTGDMEAYAYYLQGNQYLTGSWGELKRLRIAAEMYGKAVAADPRFALAYAKLSEALSSLYASTTGGRPEHIDQARAAAETALRLQPGLAEAHLAMGYYHYRSRKSYDAALREFVAAQRLQPNAVEVIEALGLLERRRGRLRDGVQHLKQAAELDPRSAELASDIGMTDWFLRDYPESERQLDRAIALAPDWVPPHAQKAWLYVSWRGDLTRARETIAHAADLVGLGNVVGFMNPDAIFMLPDDPAHRAAFEELAPRDFEDDTALYALSKAEWFRLRGAPRLVRAYCDSARAVLEVELRADQTLHWRRSFLGYAYAGLGRSEDAIREGAAALALVPDSSEAMQYPFAAFALARIYAFTGRDDLAVQQLEHLLSVPSLVSVRLLRADPTWRRLDGNPRFQRLLDRESAPADGS